MDVRSKEGRRVDTWWTPGSDDQQNHTKVQDLTLATERRPCRPCCPCSCRLAGVNTCVMFLFIFLTHIFTI